MATKPTGATTGTVEPYTSPMNLTCVTATQTTTPAATPPSMLLIFIRTDGHAPPGPPPNEGWTPFIGPDKNIEYNFEFNGAKQQISGECVAVFGKNS